MAVSAVLPVATALEVPNVIASVGIAHLDTRDAEVEVVAQTETEKTVLIVALDDIDDQKGTRRKDPAVVNADTAITKTTLTWMMLPRRDIVNEAGAEREDTRRKRSVGPREGLRKSVITNVVADHHAPGPELARLLVLAKMI